MSDRRWFAWMWRGEMRVEPYRPERMQEVRRNVGTVVVGPYTAYDRQDATVKAVQKVGSGSDR